MKKPVIVDTNVPVVANGHTAQASIECQQACLTELLEVQKAELCLLDSAGAILDEYLSQKPHGFPQGPGDLFFIWVYDNQANPSRCARVKVTPLLNDRRMFAEFPDDPKLAGFDPADKKFVAVALASNFMPPILNAVDSDWREFKTLLATHNVWVRNLCPNDLKPAGR